MAERTVTLRFLTLAEIKDQLRITSNAEDNKLMKIGKAAEETVLDYLNRGSYDEAIASLTEEYGEIPERVYDAALELCEHQYQYPGLATPSSIYSTPYNWDFLLAPLMKL